MLLDCGDYARLPDLDRVVSTPVLARDGSITQTPGYHKQGRLWHEPSPDLLHLAVPDVVTEDDLKAALRLLQLDVFGDFPFADQASAANALGAALVPFVRDRIE